MPNELSTLAKYVANQITTDSIWLADAVLAEARLFEQVIPVGIRLDYPAAMFVNNYAQDDLGAFGFRLYTEGLYEIKMVVEGADFSLLENGATQIDRIFDWTNQIDVLAGRPKSQDNYIDPDNGLDITIMTMLRQRPVNYTTFIDGVNYCHSGGEYYIQLRIT